MGVVFLLMFFLLAGVFTWNEKKERKSMSSRKGKSVFAIEPRLKQASDRFLEKMAAESLESRFPSSLYTQEFAQIVEELWNNPAIKAVYERRAELYSLPTVANYYLDRVYIHSCPPPSRPPLNIPMDLSPPCHQCFGPSHVLKLLFSFVPVIPWHLFLVFLCL
jgi:hypothetical protein